MGRDIGRNMHKIRTGRSGAIKFVARILRNARYGVVVHDNKDCDCKWIEVWNKHPVDWRDSMWIGNLNLTLMGTWFTTNMTGENRKKILNLIPDELEITSTLKETHLSKAYDYGFNEEE